MVSEGLSLVGISNIQMICFEYIFPDLLPLTSQMTIKQNEWLNSCFCRGETTLCCVLFNQAHYYGRNLHHRFRKIKIGGGGLDMQVTTFSTFYSIVRQTV